jgi:hypothetical protein
MSDGGFLRGANRCGYIEKEAMLEGQNARLVLL